MSEAEARRECCIQEIFDDENGVLVAQLPQELQRRRYLAPRSNLALEDACLPVCEKRRMQRWPGTRNITLDHRFAQIERPLTSLVFRTGCRIVLPGYCIIASRGGTKGSGSHRVPGVRHNLSIRQSPAYSPMGTDGSPWSCYFCGSIRKSDLGW